ncbi:MAG: D-sedoheptulose 7-phosphate isomerase [Bacteroidales bacterium]|nr:D-sedoheptulose 7-phosphate isomerase [Bacteroidales bacterium]MCF8333024.1 D-sedoheptulose 7-phosphate isomerase [Bacteroidales bacterium]
MDIKKTIQASIDIKKRLKEDEDFIQKVNTLVDQIKDCFEKDGKVLFCGNGGSAADAQHLAAEFTGRFYYDRPPLFSEALHVNTSHLTAVANDYSFDEVYSRLVKAKGRKGDILVGLSTSGNSSNIVKALEQANRKNMITVALTGETGGKMKEIADILLSVPSNDTPRIQEGHIMIGHLVCEAVESKLFPKN